MWKKGLVENLNQGLWCLTLYLSCCFPTSASGLLGTAPPPPRLDQLLPGGRAVCLGHRCVSIPSHRV